MNTTFFPKTLAGKWATGMFIVFAVLAVVGGMISKITGNSMEYPNPLNSPLLGTAIYLMFAAAITASVVGLIAVRKYKERSVLVYISIPLGLFYFVGIVILLIGYLTNLS